MEKNPKRFIINPEADPELASILEYLLKRYFDYGWYFIEEKNQCSFMTDNFYKLIKALEPDIFEQLKDAYPPGMRRVVGTFRSGLKGTGSLIHSWIEVGSIPMIIDPTYKQFLKVNNNRKFSNMSSRYKKRNDIDDPED